METASGSTSWQLAPAKCWAIDPCLYWEADDAFEWIVVQLHRDRRAVKNFLTSVSWSWGTHSSAPSCQVRGNWCHWRFCDVRTHLELPGAHYFNRCLSISHWKEPAILLLRRDPLKTHHLGCTKDWHSPLQIFEPFLCLSRWKQHSVLFWLFQTGASRWQHHRNCPMLFSKYSKMRFSERWCRTPAPEVSALPMKGLRCFILDKVGWIDLDSGRKSFRRAWSLHDFLCIFSIYWSWAVSTFLGLQKASSVHLADPEMSLFSPHFLCIQQHCS